MAQIIVKLQDKENVIQLEKDVISLGRIPQNDVILRGDNISRRHCEIRRVPDGYTVVDLESRNGTFVNDLRVKEKKLEFGDRISVGDTIVIFEKELPPASPARPLEQPGIKEAGGAAPPAELPVRTSEDFLAAAPTKFKWGWLLFFTALIIIIVFVKGRLDRARHSADSSAGSGLSSEQPGDKPTGPLLPGTLAGQAEPGFLARLERLMQQGREFESNNEFGFAAGKYEEIIREVEVAGDAAARALVLKNMAQGRLREIGNKADGELQVLNDLLKEAQLTGRPELYQEISKKAAEFTGRYQGTKWVESVQAITSQVQSANEGMTLSAPQESLRLLNLANGYRQEKKSDLARLLYEKIINDYSETESAAEARRILEEMNK